MMNEIIKGQYTVSQDITKLTGGSIPFDDKHEITSIFIHAEIEEFDFHTFDCSFALMHIDVDGANQFFSSEDGVLYNKDKTTLLAYPVEKPGEEFSIPGSVKKIGAGAFSYCDNLVNISIPDSVTEIEYSAFKSCSKLIGIHLSKHVVKIEPYAFYGCSGLMEITVDTDNPSYCAHEGVLYNKKKTHLIKAPPAKECKTYIIPPTVESFSDFAFHECNNIEEITVPEGTTELPRGLFECCQNMKRITLPDSLLCIYALAIGSCPSLESIVIPQKVLDIGAQAFYRCESLKEIHLPESVTHMGHGLLYDGFFHAVFSDCRSLQRVNIPPRINEIAYGEFQMCDLRGHMEIPENVTRIGSFAFASNRELESITIPPSVTEIEEGAFDKCGKLTIYCKKGSAAYNFARENKIPAAFITEKQ